MAIRAAHDLLPLVTLLFCCPTAGKDYCPQAALPIGARLARIGDQVEISCGPGGAEGTEWRFNGQGLSASCRQALNATTLTLSAVQLNDTGNYVCLRNGRKAVSVRLLIGEAPKTPAPSCFTKSYLSPIRCEWRSKELNRMTKCNLYFRMSRQGNTSSNSCRFFAGKQVCACTMRHEEGEHEHYYISLAASNGFGCASKERVFTFDDLLKSDPPELVKVKSVQKAAQKLNVTWSYPQTWRKGFYALQFEISYGFQQEARFKTVTVKNTNFLITDALPDKNYTVQIRAKEEFNHGSWSEWSAQAFGTPWADPRKNMIPEEDTEGYPSTQIECEDCNGERNPPQGSHHPVWNVFPQYGHGLLIMSLLTVTTLCIIIVIRYRKKWKDKATEKSKAESCPDYLPIQLITVPEARGPAREPEATAETPLRQAPGTPPSRDEEEAGAPEDPPHSDIINMSYFYIPQ